MVGGSGGWYKILFCNALLVFILSCLPRDDEIREPLTY